MKIERPAVADTSGYLNSSCCPVFDAFGKRGVDRTKMLEFDLQAEGVAVHSHNLETAPSRDRISVGKFILTTAGCRIN